MKKILLIITVLVISLTSVFALTSCSNTTPVPGVSWTPSEVVTYKITDTSASNANIGTLVITTKTVSADDPALHDGDFVGMDFSISSNTINVALITEEARDLNGNLMMRSSNILVDFTSVATYKEVNYGDKNYSYKAYYSGKYFYYSVGGAETEKLKIKSGYASSSLLYTIARCYEINNTYSSTFNVLSPLSDTLEEIKIASSGETATKAFDVSFTNDNGELETANLNCIPVTFERSEVPVGSSITVYYTPSDFKLSGDFASQKSSFFIPAVIVENNLTYTMINATAK